jgi:hypothetical protein
MRYYLYISDTKLDMLYGQIPQGILSKLEAEVTVDLPVLKTTFRDKESQPTSRYAQLDTVISYLQKEGRLGTIEHPSAYFAGTMPMRWGVIGGGVVYFTGSSGSTLVGLGGAAQHVIGSGKAAQEEETLGLGSHTAMILNQLRRVVMQEEAQTVASPDQLLLEQLLTRRDSTYALESVRSFAKLLKGTEEHVQFVARKLAAEERRGQTIVLGTPIFVALTD